MAIEIIIPKGKKELADGRELNYEYAEHIGAHPLIEPDWLIRMSATNNSEQR